MQLVADVSKYAWNNTRVEQYLLYSVKISAWDKNNESRVFKADAKLS